MAWTYQCKTAFKANAEGLFRRQGKETKKNLWKILSELSEQSGIPRTTLYRWWRDLEKEKEITLKNESIGESGVTNKDNKENEGEEEPAEPAEAHRSLCIRCGENKVEINSRTKIPHSENSKYYGLCSPCRKKTTAIETLDKDATQKNGILAVCPKCNHGFYINKERIKGGKNE